MQFCILHKRESKDKKRGSTWKALISTSFELLGLGAQRRLRQSYSRTQKRTQIQQQAGRNGAKDSQC